MAELNLELKEPFRLSSDEKINYRSRKQGNLKGYMSLFAIGFLIYLVAVCPILFRHKGLFFYYGDYNVQQVPFYILAHRAIRSGNFFWNWNLDLGGDLLEDMSFYLLGSPFFWLTIPFSEKLIPYLMPFLMALKFGIASANSYLYIRRYTKTFRGAATGALIFAFSGFNTCNIVFNHFTDAVAFFPIVLMNFEKLMAGCEHRGKLSGNFTAFAFTITFCSIINYYFFFGMALFLALYFWIRYAFEKDIWCFIKRVWTTLLAFICGLMIAAAFLLPAVMGLVGNSRLTDYISGYDAIAYSSGYLYWDIIKSLVMLPDIIGRGTLFYTDAVKNASLASYLPMFGLTGVFALFVPGKKVAPWLKKMLLACLIIAFIPGLNSAFSLFNAQYYARWYYMPVMLMALATAMCIENTDPGPVRRGSLCSTMLFLLFVIIALLPVRNDEGEFVFMEMALNKEIFWLDVLGTAVFYAALILILFLSQKLMTRLSLLMGAAITAATFGSMITLINGSYLISDYGREMWQMQMLETAPASFGEEFYRIETDHTATNYEMSWGIPTIHCFLSTVSGGIFDFYNDTCGITRKVESDSPLSRKGLRAILSARYYLENTRINDNREFESGDGTADYNLTGSIGADNGFTVFENLNFIPMGFSFDYYISESEWKKLEPASVDYQLVKVLILPDDKISDVEKAFPSMTKLTASDLSAARDDMDIFRMQCALRRESACTEFKTLKSGFEAVSANNSEDRLVFFSVPYAKGFRAEVDGAETEIIKADFGLMAVRVPLGVHVVSLRYFPPYLQKGIILSIIGLVLLITSSLLFKSRDLDFDSSSYNDE
ncbi:YfhO family protein [Butyrivibrio sp. MC2013]|uniref:YfhO family protein n=1 Tax=Butyrivibrio sp. MC2013 TaxID=1280686 RepID=UPI0004117ED9|nr:YfhO family protein [Butyrivibrio sp. MC2013]